MPFQFARRPLILLKTVALVDFAWGGHHPSYFRLFCQALLGTGCRVISFCPRPEEVASWDAAAVQGKRLDARELTDEVQHRRWRRKIPQAANRYRFRQCAHLFGTWEAENSQRIDLVVFACLYNGVGTWGSLDSIFPYPWTGLLLDSGSVRLPGGREQWLGYRSLDPLALFRARKCISLATLDGFIREELSRGSGGKPVYVLPEVANNPAGSDASSLAESLRAQAGGRASIGCFGQFARRKGALNFLRLAEACRDEPWFFAWAGQMEPDSFTTSERRWIEVFLASNPPNCRVQFGRLDESDFNSCLAASDVVYLCYQRHAGSSNMIGQAAAFGKPVLVSEGYCMADQTRYYQLGLCVPEDDLGAMKTALCALLQSGGNLPQPRFAAYLRDHSEDRFRKVVASMLLAADRLGGNVSTALSDTTKFIERMEDNGSEE